MYYDDQTVPRFSPKPGERFREYEIIEKIGRGGMATVYKARHTLINQIVAIKIMNPSLTSDPQFCERFLREAQTQVQLTGHQNIVTIHNFIEEHGLYLIVMEYADGIGVEGKKIRSLAEQIRQFGAMDVGQFKPILSGVLAGLWFAHEQEIVHRDIKPSNIMFTNKGIAKIVDFGIAQIVGEQKLTRTGVAVGTPKYMSPEQVRGKKLDARSDIYSLGITIYEALTGTVPFRGDTDYEVMRKQEEEEPASPRTINPRVPLVWENLILKCIAKDPDKRPQSCKEILKMSESKYVPPAEPSEKVIVPERKKVKERTAEKPIKKMKRIYTGSNMRTGVIIVCAIAALVFYFAVIFPRHRPGAGSIAEDTANIYEDLLSHELHIARFKSIGNLIAHSTYVEDAIIMDEKANLNAVIERLREDAPDLTAVHFTDEKDRIIASSKRGSVGKQYESDLLTSGSSTVKKTDGAYEGGFAIKVARKKVGALYFRANLGSGSKYETERDLLTARFISMGTIIVHSIPVENAFRSTDATKLSEIIARLQKDEPEITFVHFTDQYNRIIGSSDHTSVGAIYNSTILDSSASAVRERNNFYEAGFGIRLDKKEVGAFYFGAIVE